MGMHSWYIEWHFVSPAAQPIHATHDGHVHRLMAADYALIPIATKHTLVTPPERSARWLSIGTPPRRPADAAVADTVFARGRPDVDALVARAVPRAVPDVTRRYVGHYEGTPPQAEALRLTEPARGRLGIELGAFDPTGPNGTQRARADLERGGTVTDAYRAAVERTADTYLAAG